MTATKAVLQVTVHEERIRKKVFVTVSRFLGIISIEIDKKTGKMTVIGEVDVSAIVMKLRKICNAEIVSVEVVKPTEKKPEPKNPTEIVAYPVTYMNHPYGYDHPSYPISYCHDPYGPSTCVIM